MEKIALVTGSSRGIGRAVATELARQGWAVCINYREREDCARSLVEQLTGEGCRVMAVQADVACREQVNTMVRQVGDAFGPVALLVNNAGVAGQALFQDITDELWHRYFSVNVDGAYHAIQAVLPAMLHHHQGCIINTSSICGLIGHMNTPEAYTATKGAITLLTKSVAARYGKDNIRCNSIHPATVDTPFVAALMADPVKKQARLNEIPLGRLTSVEDVANAVLYLASDEASFLNGVNLPIDGGVTCY